MGPEVRNDEAELLLAAVRGSRLVIVTVETAGITTGAYVLFDVVVVEASDTGDAGDSMTGEAGDSKVGEAGESITGDEGDSTTAKSLVSITRREEGSNMEGDEKSGESGESGGARRGESSPADFLHREKCLTLDSDTLLFLFGGSFSPICPLGEKRYLRYIRNKWRKFL